MIGRRLILERCIASGLLRIASASLPASMLLALQEHESQRRKPTPPNPIGPFYKRLAPSTNLLRKPDDPGMPVSVSGQVVDTRGDLLPDATIEVWQADNTGLYDTDGYRYRGKLSVGRSAQYKFESVIPGHYPDRTRICQHIHYIATAPGHQPLVTQLYFATDPVFEGDPQKNYNRDPLIKTPELIRPVLLTGDPHSIHAEMTFELCLERL